MSVDVLGDGWVYDIMDDIVVDGDETLLKQHDTRR